MLVPFCLMNEPARILVPIVTVDESGGQVNGYGESEIVWLMVRGMTTKEHEPFNQTEGEVSHVCFGHYGDLVGVTSKDRIQLEETGQQFDIVGPPVHSMLKDWTKLTLLWREND